MYNQNELCPPIKGTATSLGGNAAIPASSPRITALGKPCPAWKSVVRFLSQAAGGGAFGGYAVMIGIALYNYQNGYTFLLIIALPFWMVGGAVLGLLTGALTLLFENLIEESLSASARVVVTTAIASLLVFGVLAFEDPPSWELLRTAALPGATFGLPIGLVAGSRLRLWRALLLGVDKPPGAEAYMLTGVTPVPYGLSLIGGFVLRLVGTIGFLIAGAVLASCWNYQKTDEVLVTAFSVYYFAGTAYITFKVRRRWAIAVAGTFLNSLLLLVALFWEHPSVATGQPNPLTIAFFVLAFFWMLFLGRHLYVASDGSAVARSYLES